MTITTCSLANPRHSDRSATIGDTVTPMALGYLACSLATVAALRWAGDPES